MALTKPTYADPQTGAVYPNVYLRVVAAFLTIEGQGDGYLVVAGYASKTARAAGKDPLFRRTVPLSVLAVDGNTVDVSAIATVFGAPVGNAAALPRYNQTLRAAYDWLKDPANAGRVGLDLSDAADDTIG